MKIPGCWLTAATLFACGFTPFTFAGDNPPVIHSFRAAPSQVGQGHPTKLLWEVEGADSLTVDQGVGPVQGRHVTVWADFGEVGRGLVPQSSEWRYLDDGSDQGTAWREPGFDDSTWNSGAGPLGFGNNNANTVVESGRDNGSGGHITFYFRNTFSIDDLSSIDGLVLELMRDDGAIVYLNGVEVVRSNMPSGAIDFQTLATAAVGGDDETAFFSFPIGTETLVAGVNTIAVEVHQVDPDSSDVTFDLGLKSTGPDHEIVYRLTATNEEGGVATAETVVRLEIEMPNSPLLFTEIMYHPTVPPGSPFSPTDFEFVELQNVSGTPLDLSGAGFTDGVNFTFPPGSILPPGAYALVVKNEVAFTQRYGAGLPVFGEYTGTLRNEGEDLEFVFANGAEIPDVEWDDNPQRWPDANGNGHSLELIDPFSRPDLNDPANWRTSTVVGGSPGGRTLPPVGPPVIRSFRAEPAEIAQGESTTLFWDVEGADLIAIDQGVGNVEGSSVTVMPDFGQETTQLIPLLSAWRYLDDGSDQGTAWREPGFNDSAWNEGPGILGFGNGNEGTVLDSGSVNGNLGHITYYFRRNFTVETPSTVSLLVMRLLRDDGAVVYLNGVEVARSNMPAGPIDFQTLATTSAGGDETVYNELQIDTAALVAGTNTLAVEVHQVNGTSADISFDLSLTSRGPTDEVIYQLTAMNDEGGIATAETVVRLREAPPKSPVLLTEIMYNPTVPPGFPFGPTDLEFLELQNVSGSPLDLSGADFGDGVTFTFPAGTILAPGAFALVVKNQAAFTQRYGGGLPVFGQYEGTLSNSGEDIDLVLPGGSKAFEMEWDDDPPWPDADGNGSSLELIAPFSCPDLDDPASWRASAAEGGSPGHHPQPPAGPPEILSFTTDKDAVSPGESLTFSWEVRNAENLRFDPGVGEVSPPTAGQTTITIPPNLFAGGGGGTLIEENAVWKYEDGTADLGTAWREPGFDDSSWASGPAELGFGDNDEATVLNRNVQRPTAYFRKTFQAGNITPTSVLTAILKRDDGAVVYINGQEVIRDNVPAGEVRFDTLAASVAAGDGNPPNEWVVPATVLLPGENTIAVSVHNVALLSSDLSFRLELRTESFAPTIDYVLTASNPHGVDTASVTVALETDPDSDTDDDGLLDAWEIEHFGNLDQGPNDDPDADNLDNAGEFEAGTDPNERDTDGDTVIDGQEVDLGTDPNDPTSAPPPLILFFDASTPAPAEGETVNLAWTVDLADEVVVEPGGFQGLTGSVDVIPIVNGVATSYTLTATSAFGTSTAFIDFSGNAGPPVILGFDPPTAPVGSIVRLEGARLTGATEVRLERLDQTGLNRDVPFQFVDDGAIDFTVEGNGLWRRLGIRVGVATPQGFTVAFPDPEETIGEDPGSMYLRKVRLPANAHATAGFVDVSVLLVGKGATFTATEGSQFGHNRKGIDRSAIYLEEGATLVAPAIDRCVIYAESGTTITTEKLWRTTIIHAADATITFDHEWVAHLLPHPVVTRSNTALFRIGEPPGNLPQRIAFAPISDMHLGDPPFELTASADSGLPVSFEIVSGPATLSGRTVTLTGAGQVTIRASQPGNEVFAPADDVLRSFNVMEQNEPERILRLLSPGSVREGRRFEVPVELTSDGDVGGMTFEVGYDPTFLKNPEVTVHGPAAEAFHQVNTTTPGTIIASFALPATAVPAGVERLASIQFRARSVPSTLTSALQLTVTQVAAPTGDPIAEGTTALGTEVEIRAREIVGDLNANGRFDAGDAAGMLRLITGLEEIRAWDRVINDVNSSGDLEPGDVIRVLRVVARLDDQPGGGNNNGERNARSLGSVALPGIRIESSQPWGTSGEEVIVRVVLEDLNQAITGASFSVNYPIEALRLADATKHATGPLVPNGSLALWNLDPDQDYANQTGDVHFAVSTADEWTSNGGVLAELRFTVQPGANARALWPIQIGAAEVTYENGLELSALAGSSLQFIGQPETYATHAAGVIPEGGAAALPGADYDRDGRTNLHEYLFGTDMATADIDSGTPFSIDGNTLTYRRRLTATDATWHAEVSTDLVTWLHNEDGSALIYTEETDMVENGDGTETVTVRLNGDPPAAYLRIVGEIASP